MAHDRHDHRSSDFSMKLVTVVVASASAKVMLSIGKPLLLPGLEARPRRLGGRVGGPPTPVGRCHRHPDWLLPAAGQTPDPPGRTDAPAGPSMNR